MKEKSRILICTTAYLPRIGGSEIAIREITKRLPDIQFDIITARFDPRIPSYEVVGNVSIYRVGNLLNLYKFLVPKAFLPLAIFFKAQSLNRRYHYQLIHAYQASQAAGAAWLFKLFHPRVSFLVTIQEGKDLKKQGVIINLFRNIILRQTNAITVISNYLKSYAQSVNSRAQIVVIPNGVDIKVFTVQNKIEAKKKLGWAEHKKVIITVSRLVEKNGIGDILTAFSKLPSRQRDSSMLIIAGSGSLEDDYRQAIRKLEIESSVTFVGTILHDQLPTYLSAADMFIRPSYSEGLGSAFLEAMACGTPIIGTAVGGIPDFLVDHQTGLFCEVGNPDDIARVVGEILTDLDLAGRLAANGRRLIEDKYTWDNAAEKFSKIYHEYLA